MTLVDSFAAHNQSICALTIDANSESLISGSSNGEIKIWDLKALSSLNVQHASLGRTCLGDDLEMKSLQKPGILELQALNGVIYCCSTDHSIRRSLLL